MVLCYQAWLKLDKFWKRDDNATFDNVQMAVEKLLQSIIKLMPRSSGQNWEIAKIHEQLHVAENIKYFGAHQNVHTGPQEHNHIANTKKPSKLVQRKKKTLDLQLAKRLSEKYLIETAFQKFNMNDANYQETATKSNMKDIFASNTGSKYVFTISETGDNISVSFKWLKSPKQICPVTKAITRCILNHFGEDIKGKQIYGLTELKKGDKIYRSDADYRNQGHWNDNVLIAWEPNKRSRMSSSMSAKDEMSVNADSTQVPCQLMCMFHI